MNEEARRLRAQKAYSTDPEYLEHVARELEARVIGQTTEVTANIDARFNTALSVPAALARRAG